MKKLMAHDDDDDDEMFSCHEDHDLSEAQIKAMMARRSRRQSVSAEVFDLEADNEELKVSHPKTEQQRQRLASVISKLLIFSNLDEEQTVAVLDAMFERKVKAGEHVIDQGDDGDNFYVVDKGNFDVFIKDPVSNMQVKKGTYSGSGAFGELALMYNCPRSATIVATTDGSLWAMDRTTFRRIIVRNNAKKRKKYEEFLATVPLLSTLRSEERARVADAMNAVNFRHGQRILEQGGPADYFYIVLAGHVTITKMNSNDPSANPLQLSRLGPGQYFGELALITNQPRAATATADGPCTCAAIDVQAFERLLGPCKQLLMRNIPLYEQQLSQLTNQMKLN